MMCPRCCCLRLISMLCVFGDKTPVALLHAETPRDAAREIFVIFLRCPSISDCRQTDRLIFLLHYIPDSVICEKQLLSSVLLHALFRSTLTVNNLVLTVLLVGGGVVRFNLLAFLSVSFFQQSLSQSHDLIGCCACCVRALWCEEQAAKKISCY